MLMVKAALPDERFLFGAVVPESERFIKEDRSVLLGHHRQIHAPDISRVDGPSQCFPDQRTCAAAPPERRFDVNPGKESPMFFALSRVSAQPRDSNELAAVKSSDEATIIAAGEPSDGFGGGWFFLGQSPEGRGSFRKRAHSQRIVGLGIGRNQRAHLDWREIRHW